MSRLTFDPSLHLYTFDDAPVPSVTGVLKQAGLIDFSAIPPLILGAALARGTAVHQAIHYFNERDLDVEQFCDDFPSYAPYLQAWVSFTTERRFVPALNEYRIVSPRHRVAGTLDCLGHLDDQAVLLDFKTGHPKDVAADLQTAAYYGLAVEWAEHDPTLAAFFEANPIVKRHAVQLRGDGTFRVESYTNPTDYREFLALLHAQQIVARRKGAPAGWFTEAA